ncbi:tail fiber domain-containing protein [Flavobacterium caeni]|nr:tail fiber domain-containing protein [Flavobacterium caeni]
MKNLTLIVLLFLATITNAQVGIGTTMPNSSLDIPASNPAAPSSTDGILVPRISAFPATTPSAAQNGMMVFLTTTVGANQPGFYYWDNPSTSWKGVSGEKGWALAGNSGTNPAVNFIGTTDDNDLVFKRNSVPAGRIGIGSIAFGTNALALNTTADKNIAIGADALAAQSFSNGGAPYTTDNVAIGNRALRNNNPTTTSNGAQNVAVGTSSLFSNTTGSRNVAIGAESMYDNTTGSGNMGIGLAALRNNETGDANVALGVGALMNNTTGSDNIGIGKSALISNTIGEMNSAFSSQALSNNTTGSYNLAQGFSALMSNTSGNSNTAIGAQALQDNPDGSNNVAVGVVSMAILTNGSSNTAIGANAMRFQTAGSSNIAIGNFAGVPSLTGSNQLSIGNMIYGTGMNSGLTSHIGINEPAPNAKLQINASSASNPNNSDGIIIPRIGVFPVVNPAAAQNGMMVFLTTASGTNQPGFYYWDNPSTSWKGVGSTTSNAWNLTGNSGYNAATSFIGSIDSKEVFFRHTNQPSGVIGAASTAFGYRSGGTYNIVARNTSIGSLAAESNTVGLDNTTIGSEALNRNTAGGKNVAIGNRALYTQAFSNGGVAFDTDNVAIGYEALFTTNQTMLDEGNRNVAIGNYASRSNTTGNDNTSIGYRALYANTNGFHSVAIGTQALENATGFGNNLAIGWRTMQNNTGGDNMAFGAAALQSTGSGFGFRNTAIGMQAMSINDTGSNNISIGYASLLGNLTGNGNTVMGDMAMSQSQAGSYGTAIGYQAMLYANNTTTPFVNTNTAIGTEAIKGSATPANNTGLANTATGYQALTGNTSGSYNTVNGYQAMLLNSSGYNNTAIGSTAMNSNGLGYGNVAVGNRALVNNTAGNYNTCIGNNVYPTSSTALTNYTGLGYNVGGATSASNMVELGNASVTAIRAQVTGITAYSDRRIKNNIQENVPGLSFIGKLRPVTYNLDLHKQNEMLYRGDKDKEDFDWEGKYDIEKIKQTGFIAQEVAQAAQEINYDFNGVDVPKNAENLYSVNYTSFVVPLVKAVQEQQQIIEGQNEKISDLEARLKALEEKMAK